MARKTRKCCGCKEYHPVSEGMLLPAGFFHSQDCAVSYSHAKVKKMASKLLTRVARERAAENKKTSKAVRELNRRQVRWQHKHTQKAFNRMRVLQELKWFSDRCLEPTCISCQKPLGGDQWCCGHYKTVGSNSALRYDPKNTYLQHNNNCNQNRSGDIDGYKKGLALRFGDEQAKTIIDYCENSRHKKEWAWDELEEMRRKHNQAIRGLSQDLAGVVT